MKKTFLICSLYGRINSLVRLLTSLDEFAKTGWYVDIVLQKYPVKEQIIIEMHAHAIFGDRVNIYITSEMTGPHLARCIALDSDVSDIWCILDDDMFAVKGITKYDDMVEILKGSKHIGILSSNWRKTEPLLQKVDIKNTLVRQNIVYTGGGMMLRQEVCDIIKDIPRVQYLFDNPLWSIYTYVNGYDNYRFLGSGAVHEVCTKGGRRKWLTESNSKRALPPEEWIRTRKGKGGKSDGWNEYLICDSRDITEEAHRLHKENKVKI